MFFKSQTKYKLFEFESFATIFNKSTGSTSCHCREYEKGTGLLPNKSENAVKLAALVTGRAYVRSKTELQYLVNTYRHVECDISQNVWTNLVENLTSYSSTG